MAYEVEAITPTTTPTDASAAASSVMREERVIEPYKQRTILKVAPESSQTNTNDTSTQEAKPEATEAKPTAETVTLSPQMAALARKEQAFRRQQQELKAKETALEAERAEIADLKALKAKLESKDYSDVEKLVPYNEYAQYLIDKGTETTPEQQALKNLESKINSVEEARKSDIEKQFNAAVAERKRVVDQFVESNTELVGVKNLHKAFKVTGQQAVLDHILDTWENDGIDLSVEEAAKEVEQIAKERAQAWASVFEQEKPPVEEKKPLPPVRQAKTLTNEMTIQGEVKTTRKSFQGMTDAERYAEARRRAEERLKQITRG